MSARRLISSGSRFEQKMGFSRAVRVGAHISVAGTAPVSATGGNVALGDIYGQTKRCLEIIEAAIAEAGGSLQNAAFSYSDTYRKGSRSRPQHQNRKLNRPPRSFPG